MKHRRAVIDFTLSVRVAGKKAAWKRKGVCLDNGLRRIPARSLDGKVTLRALIDRASLELFVNNGQAAASFVIVPKSTNRQIYIEGNPALPIDSLTVHRLKSIC